VMLVLGPVLGRAVALLGVDVLRRLVLFVYCSQEQVRRNPRAFLYFLDTIKIACTAKKKRSVRSASFQRSKLLC